jgi:hypothetical protein
MKDIQKAFILYIFLKRIWTLTVFSKGWEENMNNFVLRLGNKAKRSQKKSFESSAIKNWEKIEKKYNISNIIKTEIS